MAAPVYASMIDPPATYDLDVLRAFLAEMRESDQNDLAVLHAIKETEGLIAILEREDEADRESERRQSAA